MKILVDADDLNEAFDIISDVKNYTDKIEYTWTRSQLQKACDILGPMWVKGVTEAEESNPVESDGFKEEVRKGIDWCESRLQDHDGILIEILDMLKEVDVNIQRKSKQHLSTPFQYKAIGLKNKITGGR